VVHTLTVLTLRLAEAIGLFALVAGLAMFVAPGRMAAIVDDMERSAAATYIYGAALYVVGVAILIPHHVTYDPLALIVTLFGVAMLVEGLVMVAAPRFLFSLARSLMAASRLWAIVSIVAGLLLFLAGLTGRADALP